jgi:excinuclease ABC subunit A
MAKAVLPASEITLEELELRQSIHIKGARSNNLKNIELRIPKNQLVVVTGLSGSGKSSLVMDTLYAEGQRRYVESLSSYARQFLTRMKKPEVDYIKGLCPAIAIEQKVSTSNARSTVGSLTEVYDYLRLLYARIGITYSPISGEIVKKHEVTDAVNFVKSLEEGTKVQVFIDVQNVYDRTLDQDLTLLLQKGFNRIHYKEELVFIEDFLEKEKKLLSKKTKTFKGKIKVLIDRFVARNDEENLFRIGDSILTGFTEGNGEVEISVIGGESVQFNNRFELDGLTFIEPTHQLFNYNNPYGACPKCEGYGKVLGIDPNRVIPDQARSVYDDAIMCWRGEKGRMWLDKLLENAHHFDFPVHRPYKDLTQEEKNLLWTGNEYFWGINEFFEELQSKLYKIQNRVMLARYRGKTTCTECGGGRLRKEASYVKVGGRSISELINIPIDELVEFFDHLDLSAHDEEIARRILLEIRTRLDVMMDVGLGYLTLDRLSSTLSGGETQRINLTRTLGSNLTNSLYILDEPSVGLHPKDTEKLVAVLKNLRDLGNTVVVVEHEEEVIRAADYIIDIGPLAGVHGGDLVFAGSYEEFEKGGHESLTAQYISGEKEISVPDLRRTSSNKIQILDASQHNLKGIDVSIPLNTFVVVSGVSGSGKTSLVKHILYPALRRHLGEAIPTSPGIHKDIVGDLSSIRQVELVSQNPIGKSSRSNPVTYVKAYDSIRKLFANQKLSKVRGYKPKHFSFNVEGGRCETCNGEGEITVEMQFLADVKLQCDDCGGKRFKPEILDVKYKDKDISQILDLSIEEAIDFFAEKADIIQKIQPLFDVGLGYIKLGQSSSTLSGGEAQRVKLASFLGKENKGHESIFFIFDEPTTGLHFHDILKLMDAMNALVEQGHTVLVVEHNIDVIKSADYLIDLGPTGGKQGGHLLYQGPPEGILKVKESYTGHFLKDKL